MKAIVCEAIGSEDDLQFKQIAVPDLQDQEVLIEVHYCGLNYPDLLKIRGLYQEPIPPPFVPACDVAGVVQQVGSGVTDFQVGDRVMAFDKKGGLAEYAAMPAHFCYKVRDGLPFSELAALVKTYGTSYHALIDRGQLRRGEWVLVSGATGGIGMAAIEIAKAKGAKVIALTETEKKAAFCVKIGAAVALTYDTPDLKKEIKKISQGGVDVCLDATGGSWTDTMLRTMRWNGRYLVVGFAAGAIPKVPLNLPLLKGFSIIGVFWSRFCEQNPQKNRDNMEVLLQWYEKGKVKPFIYEEFGLHDTVEAFNLLKKRDRIGKIVVKIK